MSSNKKESTEYQHTHTGVLGEKQGNLAGVVLTVPATQVSVERLFSDLKFLLSTLLLMFNSNTGNLIPKLNVVSLQNCI